MLSYTNKFGYFIIRDFDFEGDIHDAAEEFGLPYLPPYLSLTHDQYVRHGVNFAVAGATALDPKFFKERRLGAVLWTNNSLSTQLSWFRKLKPSLCTTKQGNIEIN